MSVLRALPMQWVRNDFVTFESVAGTSCAPFWKTSFAVANHPNLVRVTFIFTDTNGLLIEVFTRRKKCHDLIVTLASGKIVSVDITKFLTVIKINDKKSCVDLINKLNEYILLGSEEVNKAILNAIDDLFQKIANLYTSHKGKIQLHHVKSIYKTIKQGEIDTDRKKELIMYQSNSPQKSHSPRVLIFTDFVGTFYQHYSSYIDEVRKNDAVEKLQTEMKSIYKVEVGSTSALNILLAKKFNKNALNNLRELINKIIASDKIPFIVPATCWADGVGLNLDTVKRFFPPDIMQYVGGVLINAFDSKISPKLESIKQHRYKKIIHWLDCNYKENDEIIILSRISVGVPLVLLHYFILCEEHEDGLFNLEKLSQAFQILKNPKPYTPGLVLKLDFTLQNDENELLTFDYHNKNVSSLFFSENTDDFPDLEVKRQEIVSLIRRVI